MKFSDQLTLPPIEKRSPRDTQFNIRMPSTLKENIQARAKELNIRDVDWIINACVTALNQPNEYL
tara:strand:+ start:669 stop:863 length:195 start_codon:yes stop_codon:yes gene_type:complete